MRRRAREQGFAPCLEAREFLDVAEGFHAIEEGVALEERRVGGVDQRIGGAVEEGAGAVFLQRLLDALERQLDLRRRLVRRRVVGIGGRGDSIGEARQIIGPGAVGRARDRVGRMEARRDGFVEILGAGRLSGSMWRNSKSTFFSRSTIAARCTQGQVVKLTSRYFAMAASREAFEQRRCRMEGTPA